MSSTVNSSWQRSTIKQAHQFRVTTVDVYWEVITCPLVSYFHQRTNMCLFSLALTESQCTGHYSTTPVGTCSHHSTTATFTCFLGNLFSAVIFFFFFISKQQCFIGKRLVSMDTKLLCKISFQNTFLQVKFYLLVKERLSIRKGIQIGGLKVQVHPHPRIHQVAPGTKQTILGLLRLPLSSTATPPPF